MSLRHAVSIEQFLDPKLLQNLFDSARTMEEQEAAGILPKSLAGKIVATMFYEPSTRTRFSFEAATLRLGGQVITAESAGATSSAVKGETLADTARVVSSYADAIVIRHPEKGSAQELSQHASVPVINAGDGAGEHPTQALLDLYTIRKELGEKKDLQVALVGDLLYGRTVHSLLPLLASLPDLHIHLISPAQLRLPEEHKRSLTAVSEHQNLDSVLESCDVFYLTRVQKERFASEADYLAVKDAFILDLPTVQKMKKEAIILHPLPRVNEIAPEVDADPRAAYFRQAKNGLYLRMALLNYLLT
jgi:aspartate carbamoyltransferase catalytic subunit